MAKGHVHWDGSSYFYMHDLPRDETGRRKQKKVRGFPTKRAGQSRLARAAQPKSPSSVSMSTNPASRSRRSSVAGSTGT
jgi:hypothetical protein